MASVDISARKDRNGNKPITDEQRVMIQNATNEAYRKISGIQNDMKNIWNQSGRPRKKRRKRKNAWKNNRKIVTWFGAGGLTNYQIRRTRNRVNRIKEEFDNALRFKIIQHQTGRRSYLCNNDRTAYCSLGSSVKLCPVFFSDTLARQSAVIIHELCHKNGLIHRRHATDRGKALALAKSHPRSARKNPENYEQLSHEY